jgi:hypothetical protein
MANKIKASVFITEVLKYLGFGYVYGTVGQECTVELLQAKQRQYGAEMGEGYYHRNGDYRKGKCARWLGMFVADCSGLLKYVRKQLTGVWRDVSAQGTYDQCPVSKRGKLDAKKIKPGYFVFMYTASARRMTHVGVYIGDGEVIEARGVDHGIVKTKLSKRKWTHMGLADYMELDLYAPPATPPGGDADDDSGDASTPKPDDLPVLRYKLKHIKGDKVALLQTLLRRWNASALPRWGIDGDFGTETRDWVKEYQRLHRDVYGRPLEVDGIVGVLTWGALLSPAAL